MRNDILYVILLWPIHYFHVVESAMLNSSKPLDCTAIISLVGPYFIKVYTSLFSPIKGRFRIYGLGAEVFRGPSFIFTYPQGALVFFHTPTGGLVFYPPEGGLVFFRDIFS